MKSTRQLSISGRVDDATLLGNIFKIGIKLFLLLTVFYFINVGIQYVQMRPSNTNPLSAIENLPITVLTAEQVSAEIDQIFGSTTMPSTIHNESAGVLAAINQLAPHKILKQKGSQCNFRCSGSIQIWAGSKGELASVAIVYTAGTKIVFLVLQGPVQEIGDGIVPDSMVNLGKGLFLDTTKATWVAAYILSKGLGKAYNPSEVFSLGEGLAAWEYKQAQYGLYLPLAEIHLP